MQGVYADLAEKPEQLNGRRFIAHSVMFGNLLGRVAGAKSALAVASAGVLRRRRRRRRRNRVTTQRAFASAGGEVISPSVASRVERVNGMMNRIKWCLHHLIQSAAA